MSDEEHDENEELEDALVAQQAAIDQFAANAPEFARLNYATYSAHIEAGFPAEHALAITLQMIDKFMTSWGL